MEERQLIQVQYANGLSQEVLYPSGFLAIIYFAVTLRAAVVLFRFARQEKYACRCGRLPSHYSNGQDHKIIRRARRASTSLERLILITQLKYIHASVCLYLPITDYTIYRNDRGSTDDV